LGVDLLHDPQTLAERLLQRCNKGGEPFPFRLLILHLTARLVGRHALQLLNLYPFLLKYLQPNQRDVTRVLACLVEAVHPQVPPDELRPVVIHIIKIFVTEAQASEVIEVGLNTIREICVRATNILTEDELTDLTGFQQFKRKGVTSAARGLINTYRELHPQLLHRSLRGKEATMAITRGDVSAPQYGASQVVESIAGLELFVKKSKSDEKGDTVEDGSAAVKMMSEKVISSDDFAK